MHDPGSALHRPTSEARGRDSTLRRLFAGPVPGPRESIGDDLEGRPSALIVVSDALTVGLLTGALERAGYRVATAHDGVQAIRLLGAEGFDVLILDLNLARRTGWEVLGALRRPGAHRPTVVVTSVQNGPRLESDARAAGADEFLRRPFEPAELLMRLERYRVTPTQEPTS